MNEQTALKEALQRRIDHIRIRFPSYSIRAFAKKAGISAATLSLILNGKRAASKKLAVRLSDRLAFDPQERSEVLKPFLEKKEPLAENADDKYVQLTQDQYILISDWRAFALLNLVETRGFRNNQRWIAKRLGIQVKEVEETLERLKRLGMLTEERGALKRAQSKYRTTEDVANLSLRRSHQQTLELAMASLEKDPVERRDFTWLTLPLDESKLSEAKMMVRRFQDELLAAMGRDSQPTEVYRLAIQLFPLTRSENE